MAYLVKMPKLGLEMKQGTVIEWHVGEGDAVEAGQAIAEIESEKTTSEVEAREDGVLRRVLLDEGETAAPGEPMGIVAGTDEDIADLAATAGAVAGGPARDGPETAQPKPAAGAGAEQTAETSAEAGAGAADVRATPRARRRAEELGVRLRDVEGTGPQGAVTEADVEQEAGAGEGAEREAPPGLTLREERPLSGVRRTIARRLGESYRDAVHVTEHREVDAEALVAATEAAEAALGTDVSILDVLLLACSAALDDHPAFNATFEDDVHRLYEEHNLGIAVDVEAGLVAPVLRDVGGKSLETVAGERRVLTERALAGEYTMDDLRGGTFTVTNLGVLGVEWFDPIINPPQVAILGVNALSRRVVPTPGGDVTVRRRLPLSLSFDHRVVDGADAARFLGSLAEHLEDPWPLLPEGVEAPDGGAPGDAGPATVIGGTPVRGGDAMTEGDRLPGRRVTARNPAGMAGTVTGGAYEWRYDEPEALGGTGDAPTPVDHFAAGLAACLSLAVRYQVDKRDLDVGEIAVDVTATPERGPVESIAATVRLETDADDEAVDRAIELGERGCHVSELLRADLPVDVSWERA